MARRTSGNPQGTFAAQAAEAHEQWLALIERRLFPLLVPPMRWLTRWAGLSRTLGGKSQRGGKRQ